MRDGDSQGSPPNLKSGLSNMRAGMALVALGGIITVYTYLRAAPGGRYFQMWGLMLLGIGLMIHGYLRVRRIDDRPEARSRLHRTAAACLVVVAAASGGWYAAWSYKAPFWSAVEALARGNEAAQRLRVIAERHATKMEAGVSGVEALDSWKRSAAEAIPLRADFAAAAEAARYLKREGGSLEQRADVDARFFPLCLEWLVLYAEIERRMATESMAEPPSDWEVRHDDIVMRIQELPPVPEGSP